MNNWTMFLTYWQEMHTADKVALVLGIIILIYLAIEIRRTPSEGEG